MALRRTRNTQGLTPQQQQTARRNRTKPTHTRNYRDEHTRQQLLKAWRKQHGDWCPGAPDLNHPPHPTTNLGVDHITPRSKGGTNHPTNLRILCNLYNTHKGNR